MTDATRGARRGWALDELTTAGRENLDTEHAWRYDLKEDADAIGELALLERLGLDEQAALIDLGAGTGQLTIAAATVCERVVAVDVSPVMLQPLRAKLREAELTNVEVVQAGFLSYEHRGRPADFLYTRFALHHLPDVWKAVALARARHMVKPGGILRLSDVVYSFEPDEAEDRFEAWCAAYEDAPEGEWSRSDVEDHVRDEHSTFTWILEPMLERCGFTIEEAQHSPDGLFARYVARAS
jgi:ubiquinone/menaquinone biosynthesis C-methylase UbiE